MCIQNFFRRAVVHNLRYECKVGNRTCIVKAGHRNHQTDVIDLIFHHLSFTNFRDKANLPKFSSVNFETENHVFMQYTLRIETKFSLNIVQYGLKIDFIQ